MNDFYGAKGARFLTLLGFWMAVLAYCILQLSTWLSPDVSTYFTQTEFAKIFGGSAQLFIASIIAYLIGQFLDIHVFQFWKALTKSKHLWLARHRLDDPEPDCRHGRDQRDLLELERIQGSHLVPRTHDVRRSMDLDRAEDRARIWHQVRRRRGSTPVIYAIHEWIVRGLRIEPEPHAPDLRPSSAVSTARSTLIDQGIAVSYDRSRVLK